MGTHPVLGDLWRCGCAVLSSGTAIVPEILPAQLLVQGSALNATSHTVAQMLIGPALGGLVVAALGYEWAFVIDAASFAVSAACVWAMARQPHPTSSGRSPLADALEGLRYCRSQPWLWATLLAAGVANFASASPLGLLIALLVRNVLHQGPLALGLVLAAGGLGGGVASLLVVRLGAPRLRITAMWVAWGLSGAAVLGLALSPSIWLVGFCVLVAYGLSMYGNVLWSPLMQELVPPELLGRVSSVDWLVSLSLTPLGVLVSGAVAGLIGTRATMLIGGKSRNAHLRRPARPRSAGSGTAASGRGGVAAVEETFGSGTVPNPRCINRFRVPEEGVEPSRGCPRRFLRPLRLPFRHPGRVDSVPAPAGNRDADSRVPSVHGRRGAPRAGTPRRPRRLCRNCHSSPG